MKTFWMWAFVIWTLLFSLCGVVWSIHNTREINKMRENSEMIERGEYKWQTLLD